jgi:protein SCO1/2
MKRKFIILIAAVLSMGTASALAVAWQLFGGVPASQVTTSGSAAIGGPFTLVSTNGETVTNRTYRGKWLLTFFGYTFCPDACPTALNNISVALEKLGPDANKLQPLFITVDPRRDTREVMSEYLKSFDSRIIGLTGSQDQIDQVSKEYRVYVAPQKPESDGDYYLVSHSAYIYLMNPDGKFVNVIAGSEAGEEIATWLRKEMNL